MPKKIVVLGAGIAGCVAYHAFRSEDVLIVDAKSQVEQFSTHSAIMRLRDMDIAKFIGADFREIEIQKGIFSKGTFQDNPNILLNNLYSLKLYGELGKRSILKPGNSKRFILNNGFPVPENIRWKCKVKKIHHDDKGNFIEFDDGGLIEYDYCISTLPMPLLYSYIVGHPEEFENGHIRFNYSAVFVKRFELDIPSCVNQTIYYPDASTPVYRITIQNKTIIVESIYSFEDFKIQDLWCLIEDSFGLTIKRRIMENGIESKIPLGKIKQIPEDKRLRYIMWLTDKFNIFSFGRYSVWKPLRTDELLGDIEKVKRIVTAKGSSGLYRSRLS